VSLAGAASAGVASPDERWLAYVSNETGELEVYVRPFRRAGIAVRVSTSGGGNPRWRGRRSRMSRAVSASATVILVFCDGRALFYITPDGRVVRVSVATDPELRLGTPEAPFHAPRWSIRLFADQAAGQQLTTPLDVSPEGTRFYLRQRIEATQAATLVLDWQALPGARRGR
jgi:hypothetical protein